MTPRKYLKSNRILKTIIAAYHKHIHLIHDYWVLDTVLNKHWKDKQTLESCTWVLTRVWGNVFWVVEILSLSLIVWSTFSCRRNPKLADHNLIFVWVHSKASMTQHDNFKSCFQKSNMKRRSKLADFNRNSKAKFFLVFVKLGKHGIVHLMQDIRRNKDIIPRLGI